MTYKTILAYFGNEESTQSALQSAADLAAKQDAHLIGLYVVPAIQFYPTVAVEIPASVIEVQRDHYRNEAERIRRSFEEVTSKKGVSAEWRTVDALQPDRAPTIIENGRTTDLIIVALREVESEDFDNQSVQASIAMQSGLPVLLIPDSSDIKPFGDRVFVAWDGGREAARAVHDALPILTSATQTYLHRINPPPSDAHDVSAPAAELATSLARHGVKVETSTSETSNLSVGEELLSEAYGRGCDMIVMGAYGHSRMREFIFGGVTRHVFKNTSVPVLMSH